LVRGLGEPLIPINGDVAFAGVKLVKHFVCVDDALAGFSFFNCCSWVGYWHLINVLKPKVLEGNLVKMLFEAIDRVLLCNSVNRIVELLAAVLDSVSPDRFLNQLNIRGEI